MTGLECLKEEMRKRGCTNSQVESKTVLVVLEILAQSDGAYTDLDRLQRDRKELADQINALKRSLNSISEQYRELIADRDKIVEDIKRLCDIEYNKTREYIDRFFQAIAAAETEECRDAIRTAQMFVNTAFTENVYQQTAFNIALGAILSRGNVGPMEELHKIDPAIPRVTFESDPSNQYSWRRSWKHFRVSSTKANKDGDHSLGIL